MKSRVALTFDVEFPDGPAWKAENLELILGFLDREVVPATFFLQGRWVDAHPEVARRMVRGRHVIGNHSFSHCDYRWLSREGLRNDVVKAEQSVRRHTGRDPRPWFRLPYGGGNNDPAIQGALAELGYHCVGWNVDGRDWDSSREPAAVASTVLDGVARAGHAVVLLDGGRTAPFAPCRRSSRGCVAWRRPSRRLDAAVPAPAVPAQEPTPLGHLCVATCWWEGPVLDDAGLRAGVASGGGITIRAATAADEPAIELTSATPTIPGVASNIRSGGAGNSWPIPSVPAPVFRCGWRSGGTRSSVRSRAPRCRSGRRRAW